MIQISWPEAVTVIVVLVYLWRCRKLDFRRGYQEGSRVGRQEAAAGALVKMCKGLKVKEHIESATVGDASKTETHREYAPADPVLTPKPTPRPRQTQQISGKV